jgi:NAD-dependent DNA ligase
MIRGIGPVYAKKLLRAFGEKVFDVIEAEPNRLREVDGIGRVRASRIVTAWAEQKVVREIMCFCIATASARRGRCGSTRPTASTPCRSCRRIPIGWRATFARRLQDRRRDRHEARNRQDRYDSGARRYFLRAV